MKSKVSVCSNNYEQYYIDCSYLFREWRNSHGGLEDDL